VTQPASEPCSIRPAPAGSAPRGRHACTVCGMVCRSTGSAPARHRTRGHEHAQVHYPTTRHLLSTCTPTRRGTTRNAPATHISHKSRLPLHLRGCPLRFSVGNPSPRWATPHLAGQPPTSLGNPPPRWATPHLAGQPPTSLGDPHLAGRPSPRWATPHLAGRPRVSLGDPPPRWATPTSLGNPSPRWATRVSLGEPSARG
jgi:hypothetical protein